MSRCCVHRLLSRCKRAFSSVLFVLTKLFADEHDQRTTRPPAAGHLLRTRRPLLNTRSLPSFTGSQAAHDHPFCPSLYSAWLYRVPTYCNVVCHRNRLSTPNELWRRLTLPYSQNSRSIFPSDSSVPATCPLTRFE